MSQTNDTQVFHEKAMFRYKPNWFLKRIGFKYKDSDCEWKFKWGSFTKRWGTRFEITEFDKDHDYDNLWNISFALIWGSFWINLPKWLPEHHFDDEMQGGIRQWGFHYCNEGRANLRLSWGKRWSKFFDVPWTLDHYRTDFLMKDGTWQRQPERWDSVNPTREEFDALVATEIHQYKYLLKKGEFQVCDASITVSEIEWRRKWLKKFPIFNFVKRTINITFSSEVGERSGSWKGGVIGTSFEMRPDETPKETLKRMERTKTF